MRIPLSRSHPSADFHEGLRAFQLGFHQQAADKFMAVLERAPDNADALQCLRLCHRRMMPMPEAAKTAKPTLVWQFRPEQSWEYDWIHSLLDGAIAGEVVDNSWSHIADPMIVVDNRLVAEKTFYYRRAFEQGARVILLHLSDEIFADDYGAYRYCDGVIRNFWSGVLAAYRNVFFFPLGFKSGFARLNIEPKPAGTRKYTWSFAGDPNKSSRAAMAAAMNKVPGGFWHGTSGFGAADSLSTTDYRALMDDSVFIPCPAGWYALESFRTYEALEAGCIPIVERRADFDYYTGLLGDHPIPAVKSWEEGAALVERLKGTEEAEALRLKCWTWWQAQKARVGEDMRAFVSRILAGD